MRLPGIPFLTSSKSAKAPVATLDEGHRLVGWVHLVVAIISVASGTVMVLSKMDAYPSVFALGIACFAGWLMNRAGKRQLSSVTLIAALLAGIQYNVLQGYGMHDVAIIAWPALIFFSGLLFGSRAIPYITALVMLLSVLTRMVPNAAGFDGDADDGDLVVMLLILAAFGLLAMLFQRGSERAIRALRESEELQSLFMRHSPIYTYIKSVTPTEDRLLHASDNLHDLLGTPSTEPMIGRTMEELFPAGFAAKITADDRAVVVDGAVLERDEELDGRHYATIKFPLVLGDRTLLAGYSIDITERKRAEEALRVGEERYHNLFDRSIVVVADCQGRWIEISPLFCELVGYSREELSRLGFADITHPEDLAANLELNERLSRGEVDSFFLEKRYLHKSGRVIWANLSKTSVRDASGAMVQAISVIQDITVRKEAEAAMRESESRFRAFIEQSPMAIGVFNLEGKGLYANGRFMEVLGLRREEELVGRPAHEFFAPQFREDSKERSRLRTLGLPVPAEYESVCVRADGTRFPVHLAVAPIELPGGAVSIAFLSDITERKRAEEDRIARELADRANRAKSEFLSRMSHELRTPLNAILGFAQLLKMDELRPDQERGVDQIDKSGRHLLNLVNEVLDIAKIEAGRMRLSPEPVQLEGVVEEALELIRPLAGVRRISVSYDARTSPGPLVLADRQGLMQVLLNLLSNAVKYNREGGEIAVMARDASDGHLRLQVKDTGQGIAPEKMGRLFVPFDRLGMEALEQEGTGLGLALSKGLMEAMGGSIGAKSALGKGSTFWLELKQVEA
jgi:PAS domain S-box-containing protein